MMKKKIPLILKEGAKAPHYASEGASGADLSAHLEQAVELLPGNAILIPTGLFLEIPKGHELQIRPRSGLALKHQITVLNSPGTIDSDYRGELKVILINHGKEAFLIEPGMRIAQAVLCPFVQAEFISSQELSLSTRGDGGFGHSGLH